MSVELVVAIAAGLVSVIGSIGALLVSLRTGEKFETDSVIKKEKLEQIHILVDGRLSEALKEIAALRQYIDTVVEVSARPSQEGGLQPVPPSSPGNFSPPTAPNAGLALVKNTEELKLEGTVTIKP